MSSFKRRSAELLEVAKNFRAGKIPTDTAIFDFLSALDCPRSLAVWILYKTREHDQLTSLGCRPEDYGDNPYAFRLAYIATEFLSKASFLKTTVNKKDAALEKFHAYEAQCGLTNIRFGFSSSSGLKNPEDEWLLSATVRQIERILGSFSSDEFVENANWGPGVSTRIKGQHVSAINKFQKETGITRDLYSFVSPWFSEAYPRWSEHLSPLWEAEGSDKFEVGNVIVTVPKNSKTDRVIAIEPGINLFFQKSIGNMIRRRLLRVGVDLNSQEKNQQLAKTGSSSGVLATVDFSSASDSIARELVRVLMPPRWFQVMDVCRSKVGRTEQGEIIQWKKFSSMGNGFTFELESLIFYAAALAVASHPSIAHGDHREQINVFGDDVIIPVACFPLFQRFSETLGFTVNPKKSYSTGYFRESCGSHYFAGVTAKPIYLKERLKYVESFYKLANNVRNLAHRHDSYRGCDSRFRECWDNLYRRVPEPLRLCVPNGVGDSGFASNFDEATPSRARYGIEGYFYRGFGASALQGASQSTGLLLARLWVPSNEEYGNSYALRGRIKRVVIDPLIAQWYNLGEWSI